MPEQPRFLVLDRSNNEREHLCCALSGGKHVQGVVRKKEFLAAGFQHGLTFRKLDVQGKVFAEYAPAEVAWRPVLAPGFIVIHCLWVSGKYKGQGFGSDLLRHCMQKGEGYSGVVSVTGSGPYLTDTSFYIHHGFEVVDHTATGFDLVCYRSGANSPTPRFAEAARAGRVRRKGLHFEYSFQCPFVPDCVEQMSAVARRRGLAVTTRRLLSPEEAQCCASPFGTFGVFLHGQFLSHELMSARKFDTLLGRALAENV
jgi:GNAT superfamily N-acetyltransferase